MHPSYDHNKGYKGCRSYRVSVENMNQYYYYYYSLIEFIEFLRIPILLQVLTIGIMSISMLQI
jgi:hypothetical protein